MHYDKSFYKNVNNTALSSARVVVPMILELLPETESVVDFGCGQGAWLSVFKENGINEVRGFDGEWVQKEGLLISETEFSCKDMSKPFAAEQKYDLAISLEVAEHIPENFAEAFVETIASSSDNVVFSAAIPYQGGTEHVNEQWADYWANLFAKRGFVCLDVFRDKIWNNKKVAPYYSQNILFYRKENSASITAPKRLVHPKLQLQRIIVRILGRRLINVVVKVKNLLQKQK